jgi:prophage regulatory protein
MRALRSRGERTPRMEPESMHSNTDDALVRIEKIIGPNGIIPVSRTSWYEGIRIGIYPKPIRLGRRTSVWRMSDLMRVVQKGA